MDKEEFRTKLEEINHLVEKKDYKGAMNVVDSIDWRRVKNVRTLCVVGEIYASNKRYEDSRDIFLLAYHRSSIGKNILYRLIEVSLKMGNFEEAMEYYEEFCSVAPSDHTSMILKYKILKAQEAPIEEQIQILENYKEKEFTEKWSYELAQLYYKSGDKKKCEDLCNEMILWFSDGSYVMKALNLKQRMGVMTSEEKTKYEEELTPKLYTKEELEERKNKQEKEEKADSEEIENEKQEIEPAEEISENSIESISINQQDLNNSETLQEKITKGIRDIFGVKKSENIEDEEYETEDEEASISEEELKEIPSLEKEGESAKKLSEQAKESEEDSSRSEEEQLNNKMDFSRTMKMPELKIPKSMRRTNSEKEEGENSVFDKEEDSIEQAETNKAEESEEVVEKKQEEEFKEKSEVPDLEFNLEDTILAAATAQGIEIPEDIPEEKISQEHTKNEQDDIFDDITEEDLEMAEQEFLNGPAGKDPSVPDLEMDFEEILTKESAKEASEVLEEDIEDIPISLEEESFDDFEEAEEALLEEEENEVSDDELAEKEIEELTEEEQLEKFIESMNKQNQRDPVDIVEREHELTEEESKLFSYFIKVPGMKDQILDTLCDVQIEAANRTSSTGNVIIMGGNESGKTRLISGLIPAICKELNIPASKVAYVFADQINGKDLTKVVRKLAGGFFVIERANQMEPETAEKLNHIMELDTAGMIVILEDDKIGMRKLIARYPKLAQKFTSIINIPVFTNDELAHFAKIYALENGYRIDNMGMLALYDRIGSSQQADQPMNIGSVKEIVDMAISKSQGGIRKFRKNSSKRVDRDGYRILMEKDFSGK